MTILYWLYINGYDNIILYTITRKHTGSTTLTWTQYSNDAYFPVNSLIVIGRHNAVNIYPVIVLVTVGVFSKYYKLDSFNNIYIFQSLYNSHS